MQSPFIKRSVFASPALSAALVWYRPGVLQADHAHDYHQLSFVLSGALREANGGGRDALEILQPSVGIKPAGFCHANTYGPEGTLLFSLSIQAPVLAGVDLSDWCWRGTQAPALLQTLRDTVRVLVQGRSPDLAGGIDDVLALAGQAAQYGRTDSLSRRAQPGWLRGAQQALRDDPALTMQALATESGVHPVHFSRTFTRLLGCTPTVYRARQRLAQALQRLLDGRESPASAAAMAGFADQSHFTREARRLTGLTPAQMKQLFTLPG